MAATTAGTQPIASASASASASDARLPALLALVLGLVVVGLVGFSHSTVLHNAAHDTRHANGFPCH